MKPLDSEAKTEYALHLLPTYTRDVAAGCNNRMPMCIGSFSYT